MHEIKIKINDRITAVLTYDEDCQGPGDYMLGKIYYVKGSRYLLGTEAVDSGCMLEISTGIASGELVGLPVYAYVHSGTQLSTTPFSCPFDSGPSGFIACSHEDITSWFGEHHCKSTEEVLEVLRSEVEEFNKFLQGDVYVITILVDGKEEETVGGFYGFDYAVEEAKVMAEGFVKHLEKTVKVFLKTGTGKKPIEFNFDFLTKLEKCVSLIQELGGGEVCMPAVSQNMVSYHWEVTAKGAKLVTTFIGGVREYGNLIEISKFRQMLAGMEVEGFNKVGKLYEEI